MMLPSESHTELDTVPIPPKPRDEDLDFFGLTDRGLVRKDNQDHFLVTTLHKTMRVHVTSLPNPELLEIPSQRIASVGMVCDGVGGHSGGEEASRAAVEAIAAYVTDTMQCFFATDTHDDTALMDSLREAATRSHELIANRARESGDRKGMATTLTMFVVVWPTLYLLQVGDSRCYRYRNGELEQLTRDQTMAQDLVDSGVLKPEQAVKSPYAHVLSSSLGGSTWVPEVSKTDVKPGDRLLLCTDGLTKHVSAERIAERLRENVSSEPAVRALVADTLAAGASDNVTVLVLRAIVR
jgi:serine/threonine protein phosphatase PrpC